MEYIFALAADTCTTKSERSYHSNQGKPWLHFHQYSTAEIEMALKQVIPTFQLLATNDYLY